MSKRWHTVTLTICVVALAAAALWMVFDPTVTRQEAAAWFQAIGGVLAVVAALMVARAQEERAETAERKAEEAVVRADRQLIQAIIDLSGEPRFELRALWADAQAAIENPDPFAEVHGGKRHARVVSACRETCDAIERLLRGRPAPAAVALSTSRIVRQLTIDGRSFRAWPLTQLVAFIGETEALLDAEVAALVRARDALKVR